MHASLLLGTHRTSTSIWFSDWAIRKGLRQLPPGRFAFADINRVRDILSGSQFRDIKADQVTEKGRRRLSG